MSAGLARLRWRCRRGTRELDQLLGGWLDERWPASSTDLRAGFAWLVEQQDPDLWDWILGNGLPADPNAARVIDEIRTRHRI